MKITLELQLSNKKLIWGKKVYFMEVAKEQIDSS